MATANKETAEQKLLKMIEASQGSAAAPAVVKVSAPKKQTLLEIGASTVLTFAVNGKADYCIYDELCFPMPWKV